MYWSGSKIEGSSFHGRAFDLIKRQVLIGTLRPDEQLPPERRLSETLGISRVTLREALKLLESEGFLVSTRGAKGGNFVATDDRVNQIARKYVLFQPDRVWRSLEYLRANLVLAGALASERRNATDLHRLGSAVAQIGSAQTGGALREAVYLFCAAVAKASMNPFLEGAVEQGMEGIFHPIATNVREVAERRRSICEPVVEAIESHRKVQTAERLSSLLDDLSRSVVSALNGRDGTGSSMEEPASAIQFPGADVIVLVRDAPFDNAIVPQAKPQY